jgi:tetratricopeptide (TPR) repeat protein
MWHDWDWAGARASLGRARELAPDKPEVLRDFGLLMYLLGRYEEAVTNGRRAIELDPLSAISYLYLSFSLLALGKSKDAEAACRRALEISPDVMALRYWMGMVLDAQGRQEEALADALLEKVDWVRLTTLACLYHRIGRRPESDAALAELKATNADLAAFQVAQVHAFRGEVDEAFAWLERAYDQRDAGISMVKSCPWFDLIKGDPRWDKFLRKVGLGD